ncbi:hypothetical protein E5676_scaffold98G003000 [Cucumis melo var. makuwa]|uniref:Uncharacterized protein n=1 Tax=Cucumis melo var. makuwa TaxID=1194695 RepID=A0A5D3C332_CUCMM|nr:hypothetical protein E5676_scaffold98G003000 [Cucumis melo var. makuwa]
MNTQLKSSSQVMAVGPDSKAFYFMHGTLITSLKSEMLMDVSWIFIVQTIFHSKGKWLMERNPRVHGSFSSNAAANFDEYDFNSEQYSIENAPT